jgi:hypothetical protein
VSIETFIQYYTVLYSRCTRALTSEKVETLFSKCF